MTSIRSILFRKKRKKYCSREEVTNLRVLDKIKKVMEDEKLFLNPDLSLNSLAEIIGTNRTYLSNAFKFNDTTFKQYISSLRVAHLFSTMNKKWTDCENAEWMAHNSGFPSRRLMDKALKESLGESYCDIKKRKNITKSKRKK